MAETTYNSVGFSLAIDEGLIKRMQEADKLIDNLGKHSEKSSQKMITAFRDVGDKGVDYLISKLQEAQKAMAHLAEGKVSIDSGSLDNLSNAAVKTNTNFDKLYETITKVSKYMEIMSKKDLAGKSLDNQFGTYGGSMGYSFKADTYEKEAQAIKYLTTARNNLSKSDELFAIKRNALTEAINRHRESLRLAGKTDKEIADDMAKASDKRVQAALKEVSAYEARKKAVMDKWYSSSPERALSYSSQTKSINDQIRAIKYLEAARKNLSKENLGEGQYQFIIRQITDEINRQKKSVDELTGRYANLHNKTHNLLNISEQLWRRLALAFSVSQVTGYINNLIRVRGEFELQQRSLEAILKNKDEANKLWSKTVNLAINSPFRIKELVTYTKQLAAYRIEASKLYETNKMLADISAGLGVDMNRLILAFGQVKAANYLRGTELRQFSEAGVNILGELAQYFSELENRAVSVGDVFERVSKRMVSFRDVENVLKRLTDEGGTFYRMQEIQAETIKGMMSNLQDSIDIMLNDIGKNSEGVIKTLINLFKTFIDNWRVFATILKGSLGLFIIFKLNALRSNDAVLKFAKNISIVGKDAKSLKYVELFHAALIKVGKGFKAAAAASKEFIAANWWLIAIGAAIKAIFELVYWNDKYNQKIEGINRKRDEERATLVKLSNEYKELTKNEKNESITSEENFNKKLQKLKELQKSAGLTSLYIPIEFEEITKDNIDEIFGKTEDIISYMQDLGAELGAALARGLSGKEGSILGIHFLGDNLETDLKDMDKALTKIGGSAQTQINILIKELEGSYDKLSDEAKLYLKTLKEGRKENELQYNWYERQVEILSRVAKEFNFRNKDILRNASSTYIDVISQIKEVEQELDKVIKRFLDANKVENFADLPKEQQVMLQMKIDEAFEQMELSDQAKRISAFYTANAIKIPYTLTPAKVGDEQLSDWAKRYNEFIKTLGDTKLTNLKEITDISTTIDELLSQLNDAIKGEENVVNRAAAGSQAYTKEEVRLAKIRLKANKEARSWLVGMEQSGDDKQKNILNSRISLIKEVNKAYLDLAKTFDVVTAKEKVMSAYSKTFAEAFKGTNIKLGNIDFTGNQGIEEALKSLMPIAVKQGKEAVIALEKEISSINATIGVDIKKGSDKQLVSKIEGMLSDYKFYLEIDKLNIPQDIAKNMYGITTTSLEEIKSELLSMQDLFVGEDMLKKYDSLWKSILDMENKAQMDRLKNYTKYLTKATSEFVQIKLKSFDEIAEIKKAFTLTQPFAEKEFGINATQWGMLSDTINETKKSYSELTDEEWMAIGVSDAYISKIRQYLALQDESARKAISGVKRDTDTKLQKQQWEDFKSSDMYVLMFEDIENLGTKTLESLKDKLDDLKQSLSSLPADQVKEIVNQINKIDDALTKRNPFEAVAEYAKEILKYSDLQTLQIELINAESEIEKAQNVINVIDEVESARDKKELSLVSDDTIQQYNNIVALAKAEGREVSNIRKEKQDIVNNSKKDVGTIKEGITANAKYAKSLKALSDWWGEINDKINSMFDSGKKLMTTLGEESDSTNMVIAEISQNMVSLVLSTIQMTLAMKAAGKAANSALGVIGWIAMALEVVVNLFSSLFGQKDKKLQKQIEELQESVKQLEWSFDRLKNAMSDAFSLSDLESYTRQARVNLNAQIKSYKMMIEAERAKKSSDKSQIAEWQRTINDLQIQLLEVAKDAFDKATGDILDNTLSAANEYTNAWLEAFQKTGSGLSGLTENFKEATLEMVKQQASLFITGTYVDRWKKNLEQYINANDLELTTQEANAWMKSVQTELPMLNAALEQYFNAMKQAGLDLSATSNSLSGLQKGIQGITENQADEIAAYLNTIRFFVSENNELIKSFYSIFSNDSMANPMIAELKAQTALIRTIKDMLGSVIGRGASTHNGAYLKVAL